MDYISRKDIPVGFYVPQIVKENKLVSAYRNEIFESSKLKLRNNNANPWERYAQKEISLNAEKFGVLYAPIDVDLAKKGEYFKKIEEALAKGQVFLTQAISELGGIKGMTMTAEEYEKAGFDLSKRTYASNLFKRNYPYEEVEKDGVKMGVWTRK